MVKDSNNCVRVRGTKVHNLKNLDVDIPRDKIVAFTGISGSGKSSLAFGTLYAEAQHRYLDSVSPYARRLIDQIEQPEVECIEGLPPAVGLHQQRGTPSIRSSVGSITTLFNSVRMLFSRAGDYPEGQSIIYADAFSPNTPQGACEHCDGIGKVFDVDESTLVPDKSLSIREGAIAAWPGAWQGKNLVRVLLSLDIDVDVPWHEIPKNTRDWILYTDEAPQMGVYRNYNLKQTRQALSEGEPTSYKGTFVSARRHVLDTFKSSQKEKAKQKVTPFLSVSTCPVCEGKKLKKASLSVKIADIDIVTFSRLSLEKVDQCMSDLLNAVANENSEKAKVITRIASDIRSRLAPIINLGLGYLSLERSTTTISPGELQRLRLATQIKSTLFGVVYVMDEPSAGLHPKDVESLLEALKALVNSGNSVFVVEHNPRVIQFSDWVVDVGPKAGINGGELIYSGPPSELLNQSSSLTAKFIQRGVGMKDKEVRCPTGFLKLRNVHKNNLKGVDCDIPLGVMVTVTGVSGSGKSSLVSQALVGLVKRYLERDFKQPREIDTKSLTAQTLLDSEPMENVKGSIEIAGSSVERLVVVNQSPIGRTPRSNLATYTGLFDSVRKLFAATADAKARRFDAGHFSFNVAKGRCPHCEGVGFVSVELLFMPSVYSPCPECGGNRYKDQILEVKYKGLSIADVLSESVSDARDIFVGESAVMRALDALESVGLGYITLGQPATELSGGEAQRIKLATELKRAESSNTLYVLDEPTTGLHLSDTSLLLTHLNRLVEKGNSVIMVEHNMHVAANSDYIIDVGPNAGEQGGLIVCSGTPHQVLNNEKSATAPFLRQARR